MKLSKREKILLLILVVFGSMALFTAYAILPAVSARSAEQQELDTLKDDFMIRQSEYEEFQDQTAQLQTENDAADALYGELYSEKTYDTGLTLSDMLASYSLTPLSLSIGDRTPSQLMENEEPMEQYAEGEDEETDGAYVGIPLAYSREINLRFTGTRSAANAFVDALSDYNIRYVLHGINMTHGGERTEFVVQISLYEFDDTAVTVYADEE